MRRVAAVVCVPVVAGVVGAGPASADLETFPVTSVAVRRAMVEAAPDYGGPSIPLRCYSVRRYVQARSWGAYGLPGTKPGCLGADGVTIVRKSGSGWRFVYAGSSEFCPALRDAPAPVREDFLCE